MYKIVIQFKQGTDIKMVIDAISHSIIEQGLFSIIGEDRKRYLIPLSNITYIEFDSQLDTIINNNKSN